MHTDLKKAKMARLFRVIDADKNGVLDRSDYETIAANVAEVRGWDAEAPERWLLVERYVAVWNEMKKIADADGDGVVRQREHAAFHERLFSVRHGFESVTGELIGILMKTFDRDHDGFFNLQDLRAFYRAYRIEDQDAAEVFACLDTNRDGILSDLEVADHVRDFYMSTNESAPGNWLFGAF